MPSPVKFLFRRHDNLQKLSVQESMAGLWRSDSRELLIQYFGQFVFHWDKLYAAIGPNNRIEVWPPEDVSNTHALRQALWDTFLSLRRIADAEMKDTSKWLFRQQRPHAGIRYNALKAFIDFISDGMLALNFRLTNFAFKNRHGKCTSIGFDAWLRENESILKRKIPYQTEFEEGCEEVSPVTSDQSQEDGSTAAATPPTPSANVRSTPVSKRHLYARIPSGRRPR